MERCFCWAYNDGPWSVIVGSIEFYSLAPTLLLTFFVHLSIVINIAYTVKKFLAMKIISSFL